MSFRRFATGAALAIAGLAAAVGIGLLANSISGDSVGLGAEPLSAGETLAPATVKAENRQRQRQRQRQRRRRNRGGDERPTDTVQVPPSTSDGNGTVTTFDDHGGDRSGSDDNSGSGSSSSGSGSDDSSGSGSSGSGSDDSSHSGGSDDDWVGARRGGTGRVAGLSNVWSTRLIWQPRPEQPEDFGSIRTVHERAFDPSPAEAQLVDLLRDEQAHVAELCLVAARDDEIDGHVFYSRARLNSGLEVLALAPMAVLPEHQRSGVGSALVTESLRRAAETSFPLVIVLGHAEYYPRFGFEPARPLGIEAPFEVPPEAWMAYRLPAYSAEARGTIVYADAFTSVT
jgi:putative acetyltransferase